MSQPRRPQPPAVPARAVARPPVPRRVDPTPPAQPSRDGDHAASSVAVKTRPREPGRSPVESADDPIAEVKGTRSGQRWWRSKRGDVGDGAQSTTPVVRRGERDGAVATPWTRVSARLSADNVTERLQERLRERRTLDRRVALIRWSKRGAVVLAAAAAGWMVLMSPLFAFDAEDVAVSGYGTVVDPADVNEIVASYDGDSLATLNTSHLENQLNALVGVAAAQVERVWPQGLRITLTPSEPVAAIPAGGDADGYRLVNDKGEQVSESADPPGDVPVITIPVGQEYERILTGVLKVVDEIPVELRERVQGIEAQTEDSIHFTLRDGPVVEWGSGEDSQLKSEVLEVLLASEAAKGASVIDVSAPTLPITR